MLGSDARTSLSNADAMHGIEGRNKRVADVQGTLRSIERVAPFGASFDVKGDTMSPPASAADADLAGLTGEALLMQEETTPART